MAYIVLDSEMSIVVLHSHGFCDFHCGPTYLWILMFSFWSYISMDPDVFIVVLHSPGF